MSATRLKRITRDYETMTNNPNCDFKITLQGEKIDDWLVEFDGPSDTYYAGLHFRLRVTFPVLFLICINYQDRYPFSPPNFQFLSKVYHPNVFSNGHICLDIIQPSTYSPAMVMDSLLTALVSLLSDPNLNSPANNSASSDWKKSNIASIVRKNHVV